MPTGQPQGPRPATQGHSAMSQGWSHGPCGSRDLLEGFTGMGGQPQQGTPRCHAAPRVCGGWRRPQPRGGFMAQWVSGQTLPTPSHQCSPDLRSPSS